MDDCSQILSNWRSSVKSLIIIRLDYYLTSLLTKIVAVTRTSQATAPQSTGLPYKSVRRLICAYLQGPQFLSLEPKPRLIWWIYNILTWCFCLAQLHETRDRPCPRPKLMIQTQQQAIKPNKTSTRQNLKRVRHLWLQTKNQISTLRINSDWHFDMPLVEPNSQSIRHYFSQTQKSCFIPPIWTIIFNQSQGSPATFAPKKRKYHSTRINREIDISLRKHL